MRFALTGSTGGVGAAFIDVALSHAHSLRALVRDRAHASALQREGVTLVEGDLASDSALRELAEGADVFVHTAAHVGDFGDREPFVEVNVRGTERAVRAAASAGVHRFVHLSSVAVYGRPDRGIINELYAPRLFGAPYEDTKFQAERVAFALGKELGMEVVALRPPVIFGPFDRVFVPRVLGLLKKGLAIVVDGGEAPLNVIDVRDLCDAILLAATSKRAPGEAFNIASSPPPTIRSVLDTIARASHMPLPPKGPISLPYGVALTLATVIEGSMAHVSPKKQPPFSRQLVVQMTRRVVYDSSKARELLGWQGGKKPLAALEQTVRNHFVRA